MLTISQVAFFLLIALAAFFLYRRISFISSSIKLGKKIDRSDRGSDRLKTMLLVAFGQKKMFKRFIPAILHFFVYAGFLIINLEVLEFILDGALGTHRLFAPFLGGFYTIAINFFEFLAVLVMASCVVFFIRRNIVKVKRFHLSEMTSWPKMDGNLILIIEIVLMIAILTMNATDQVLQTKSEHYIDTGSFIFSGTLMPIFSNLETNVLIFIERFAWWFHTVGILGFAIYVTYSKHLHIFLAFPNTYYSNLEVKGKIDNMSEVTNEVNMMLGAQPAQTDNPPLEVTRFGAKDVTDLHRINIMNAFACTECGRCSSECPANITGKKLSPRKIMMDTRDRAEELSQLAKGGKDKMEDGKSLLGDYISKEEVNACTSCNACTEACPVNIDPLSIILQLRRYIALEESGSPASWNSMFSNIETNFSPWKFAPTDRFNWASELKNEESPSK